MNQKQIVFWDWNGTLLDDVQYAIEVRNTVFPHFGLPAVKNRQTYHEQFTFPVKLYYQRAGVLEKDFQAVANAWMQEYMENCHTIPLFQDALSVLDIFADRGLTQVVLSASELDILHRQLQMAGIDHRFDDVLGLSHIYATDKTMIAKAWFANRNIDPQTCVLLGDTTHDAQVADALQIDCILIARGHMSAHRLMETGHPVCMTLLEAADLVLGRKTQTR